MPQKKKPTPLRNQGRGLSRKDGPMFQSAVEPVIMKLKDDNEIETP